MDLAVRPQLVSNRRLFRNFMREDTQAVVQLSLRAWEQVFASVLGGDRQSIGESLAWRRSSEHRQVARRRRWLAETREGRHPPCARARRSSTPGQTCWRSPRGDGRSSVAAASRLADNAVAGLRCGRAIGWFPPWPAARRQQWIAGCAQRWTNPITTRARGRLHSLVVSAELSSKGADARPDS